MNKKERKANAILAAAKKIASERMERIVKSGTFRPAIQERSSETTKKVQSPMVIPESQIVKYDVLNIVKKGKGDYRIDGIRNGQKYAIANRFKSLTKAEEWKVKHLK